MSAHHHCQHALLNQLPPKQALDMPHFDKLKHALGGRLQQDKEIQWSNPTSHQKVYRPFAFAFNFFLLVITNKKNILNQ
jgi:hypothetical protein